MNYVRYVNYVFNKKHVEDATTPPLLWPNNFPRP